MPKLIINLNTPADPPKIAPSDASNYGTLAWASLSALDANYRFVRYLEEGESFTYTE